MPSSGLIFKSLMKIFTMKFVRFRIGLPFGRPNFITVMRSMSQSRMLNDHFPTCCKTLVRIIQGTKIGYYCRSQSLRYLNDN